MVGHERRQKLIRLSAARAKVRSGYATAPEVCFSGFVAGVVPFLLTTGIYFSVSLARIRAAPSVAFTAEIDLLAEVFGIRSFDGSGISAAIANLGLASTALGIAGVIAAIILRCRIRKEPSDRFFRKKLRFPFDVLPFVGFFAYSGLSTRGFVVIYLAAALLVAYLWRFWYGIVLSVVSSLDMDRLMPKPV